MRTLALAWIVLALPAALFADVQLPHVFGNHMVIQRDMPVRVWGQADPGEKVTVHLGKNESSVVADANGEWLATMPAMPAGGPIDLTVTGKNTVKFDDVLVGEVWVCSGQSNMELNMFVSHAAATDMPAANNPELRLLTVCQKVYPFGESAPQKDILGSWSLCTPDSVRNFSAVGYYFGKRLQAELGVPVGIINSSVGGTRIESWTPREALLADPQFAPIVKNLDAAHQQYLADLPAKIQQVEAWLPAAKKALAEKTPVPSTPVLSPDPISSGAIGLYNEKIAPLTNFAIRGAIWYQGEANVGEGSLYTQRMQALITGWRNAWKEPDMPFYFVQLAPFNYGGNDPLAYLWEAQVAAMKIPHTGMAVVNDLVPNLNDIHPQNKRDVGNRLALWALNRDYGKKTVVCSGPIYKSMAIEGDKIRIRFDHAAGGLLSRDGKPLSWFTIAGADKKFVPAVAAIDGDSVMVFSPAVPKPAAVRFAWSNTAQPNLMNKEQLPASAFRTDRW